MASTRDDLGAGADLIRRALVSYALKPDETEIAVLVDGLLTYGQALLPAAARIPSAAPAVTDWQDLAAAGPADSPLGNWTYCRALARAAQTMAHRVNGAGQ